jgi:hypothetical protein
VITQLQARLGQDALLTLHHHCVCASAKIPAIDGRNNLLRHLYASRQTSTNLSKDFPVRIDFRAGWVRFDYFHSMIEGEIMNEA